MAKAALKPLAAQLGANEDATAVLDAEIKVWHKGNAASQRLATIPGIGILTASAIAATVPDPSYFRSGREFSAWLGLVPRQNSTGGKDRLGRISKRGNPYIRRLLVIGATSMLRYARARTAPGADWVNSLLARIRHERPEIVTAKSHLCVIIQLLKKKLTQGFSGDGLYPFEDRISSL